MKEYLENIEKVFLMKKSSTTGLSSDEAQKRLSEDGKNILKQERRVTSFERFLKELANPMIIILLAAAVVSFFSAWYENESFVDVIIILIVVVINAVLGVIQENKAEKAISALQAISAPTSKVIRGGKQSVIRSEDLVVGDIIVLEAGDSIPADGRIFECASLKVEEAALSGESLPVTKDINALFLDSNQKDISLGDRKNMVYMGCNIVYGRGKAVVCAIGMDTQMGKIADLLSKSKDDETPLQIKLNQLSKTLSVLVLGICALIFGINLFRMYPNITFSAMIDTFMVAVSLAVAAIPEGLAAVVTIVLSIGVTKMSKNNAIIRKLTAVETLGCTQVICSDKTGTLTQNKMSVVKVDSKATELLIKAMALCNDANVDEHKEAIGEPTECALVNYATQSNYLKSDIEIEYPRLNEVPFDSNRKMMSTIHQDKQKYMQFTKGAPDEIIKCCTHILIDGSIMPLDNQAKEKVLAANKMMANDALRVLGGAYKALNEMPALMEANLVEKELVFLGLMGMIDPIRLEAKQAIKECKDAGIRAIMITGDHRDTAIAIGKQLEIISDEARAITGMELDELSDDELKQNIQNYAVYARVQPEHKVRIVSAWKAHGKVVAMSGDGVNDAPSIKNADIGIGMGITGTDVTKNVADMVLADDNFATIVLAVEEGRRIYDNIRKAIQFLLSSNLAEVLAIFFATLFGFTILKPVHLLWINLITDTFPALALGMEQSEENIMMKKPRSPSEGIFASGLAIDVLIQGSIVTVMTLLSYFIGHYMESGLWEVTNSLSGMTMAFLTLSLIEIFHSFNMRSQTVSIFKMKHQNPYLLGAMALSLISTLGVIYIPFFAKAFGFNPITIEEGFVAFMLAFSIIPIMEVIKFIKRQTAKNS